MITINTTVKGLVNNERGTVYSIEEIDGTTFYYVHFVRSGAMWCHQDKVVVI